MVENNEKEDENIFEKLKLEIMKYGENTSIRGLSKFFKSKDVLLKILWLLLLLGSTVYMTCKLCSMLSDYYMYPVTTEYGEKIGQNIIFPDITICNLDPFDVDEPKNAPLNKYLYKLNVIKKEMIQQIKNGSLTLDTNKTSVKEVYDVFNEIASQSGFIINLRKDWLKSDDCPKFIVDCSFFGKNWFKIEETCSINNFTKHWNANYFSCYTLKTSTLKVSNVTVIRGLSILLNVGPPNFFHVHYKSSLTNSQSRGVQVSVHRPGSPPDLKRGFSVAPGTETIAHIVQTERTRLKTPYNKLSCTEGKTFYDFPTVKYTQELCTEYCQQEAIKKHCSCMTHLLNVPDNYTEKISLCGNTIVSDEELDRCVTNCLMPCNETVYESTFTSASWPQILVQLDLFEKFFVERNCVDSNTPVKQRYIDYWSHYIRNDDSLDSVPTNFTKMKESLLEIKFVMKQNFPYFQSDSPAYTDDMMIGSVGGMLSLWLGITVASGVEVIELIYLLFRRCWESRKSNNARTEENDAYVEGASKTEENKEGSLFSSYISTKL
ncbi:hypothetical protein HELRODRAFT_165521 [Helobdella robusta]|uniref:Uncharacterized protein n=1 Tax=Helobdella robusta TaxID=6412 RepID=T1EWY8_HELRO|nr:hypothetical protein HELRODRAFT_165521 [Helobdella robusta]ESN91482.1 hypothetical protein HELRODRAFT_165521 [Helobdella robusta]